MDVFTNTNKMKKLTIILVILILFNFCCPKVVRAGDALDWILVGVSSLFFWLFDGIQGLLDLFFLDNPNTNDITAEMIIKGKILLMSPNIFQDPSTNQSYYLDYGKVGTDRIGLRTIVAAWYYALRNLAIVALLSILVYIAIRMILSTVAQDKAKYKVMFKDWLVALCLVFMIHYIMVGILNLSDMITNAIGTSGQSYTTTLRNDINTLIDQAVAETDRVGTDDDVVIKKTTEALKYTVFYAATVIMNIIFIVKYLIRSITLIFLTLLAPISCITYPIDKISDGKAQAYDTWFKEYLYQVIIQPFHLLIYIVLVGSAATLAKNNMLYGMVCFGAMIPAEKFIKQMFGFKDKMGSPLGAFASGAVANQLMNSVRSIGKGGSGGGKDSGDNSSTQNNLPPKTVDKGTLMEGSTDYGSDDNSGDSQQSIDTSDQASIGDGQDNVVGDDGMGNAEYDANMTDNQDDQALDLPDEDNISEGYDNTDIEDNAPGEDDNTNIEDNTPEDEESTEKPEIKQTKLERAKELGQKALAIHEQRMTKKWGSANRGRRWLNRGGKLVTKVGKTALRGAAIAGGGLALGAFGAMFGQGEKGFAAGAALGGYASKKTITGISKAYETAGDYRSGLVSDKTREKDAFKEFSGNNKEIDKAVYSYRKNHDGENPNGEQLEQELKDRFELSRYGLTDDQIDDSLELYQDRNAEILENEALDQGIDIDELKDKAGGEDNLDRDKYRRLLQDALKKKDKNNANQAIEKANRVAGSQAKYTARLAKAYSAKDFRDPKAMENAYNQITSGLMEGLPNTEANRQMVDSYARRYLTDAAAMHGVTNIPLPKGEDRTIDVPVTNNVPNIIELLGVSGATELTDERVERLNRLTFRLQEQGYTPQEISNIAQNSVGSDAEPIRAIDKYEAQVEFLTDESAINVARLYIASDKNIDAEKVTEKQIKIEMRDRLDLFEAGVAPERMNEVKVIDKEKYGHHKKSDKEATLELTNKYSTTEMKNVNLMNKEIDAYARELVKNHKVSGNGRKEAVERFERAAVYKGTEIAHTIEI